MEFMGHADISTTMRYAHFYSDGHDLIERAFVAGPIEVEAVRKDAGTTFVL
jgi:hypothetical protein